MEALSHGSMYKAVHVEMCPHDIRNDMPLVDIELIEVVRETGGALWGASATNGGINIITIKAKLTQGSLVTVGDGTENGPSRRCSTAARLARM